MILPNNLCGIYYLKCNTNGRLYIGSSIQIRKRLYRHIRELQANIHHNPILQNIWNKHGKDNFSCGVLEVILDKDILNSREKFWIDTNIDCVVNVILDPCDLRGVKHPMYGRKHSKETKKKMSIAQNGKKHLQETKLRLSKIAKARIGPNPFQGKKHTNKTKERMSSNHADFNGVKNPFSGKTHSDKTLAKMSLSKGSLLREDILKIRTLAKNNTISDVANIIGISYEMARLIIRGKRYASVC